MVMAERANDAVVVDVARTEQIRDELSGIADAVGDIDESLDAIEAQTLQVASTVQQLVSQGVA